ncbi:MAG TPA: hypothetical protein VGE08_16245 [Steroidobacter sp.]|uniref:hypothetical protein n=1 Tax=Steroidobacter sp. TaxID=1978227 RepID=UPI002ED9E0EE
MSALSKWLEAVVLRSVGPEKFARLEYRLKPHRRASWGGPMNGQVGRVRICRDILTTLSPTAIVETGTFRGTTTEFFAEFPMPVYSVEAEPRFHHFAAYRFRDLRDRVHLTLGDSRSFLNRLAADASMPKNNVFFYLDAHWNADLPLAEEITTIFANWQQAVIMIDDFAVPDDTYAYDDYGPGAALNAEYLDRLGRTDMYRFYPSLRAAEETGAKRGCVVLCNDPQVRDRLKALSSLRQVI